MFTLRDAANVFAKIEGTPDHKVSALDKSLRNLSQRAYLPAVDRQAKADLFARHTICALRLVQKAAAFGLDRPKVEALARWLQTEPTGTARRVPVDGGLRSLSPIEEAVQRVGEGQNFDVHLTHYRDGRVVPSADWPSDDQATTTFEDSVFASAGVEPVEDCRFTLPASRLIAELLEELGA